MASATDSSAAPSNRRKWLIALGVVAVAVTAIVGGVVGSAKARRKNKGNRVAVLSYGSKPAFVGPHPDTAALSHAFYGDEDLKPLKAAQGWAGANTTTINSTMNMAGTDPAAGISSTSTTSPPPKGFFSALLSTLTGGAFDDDSDEDSHLLFDKGLFDDSGIEKIPIPAPWKALQRSINSFKNMTGQSMLMQNMASTSGLATCIPKNGSELEKAVMGPSCTIIMLTRSYFEPYRIDNVMMVNSTKMIIGNPLRLPAIIPNKKAERIFHVVAGGYLVMQSVTTYRGSPRRVGPDKRMKISMGATGMVEAGGGFHGIGMWIREQPQTLQAFLTGLNDTINGRGAIRTFGGHIFVKGGFLQLTGCVTWNFRPFGNPAINTVAVGGDYLVVGGTAVFIGTFLLTWNTFIATQVVGGMASVLVGDMWWIGGGNVGGNGLQQQAGDGFMLHAGMGTVVTCGWILDNSIMTQSRSGQGLLSVDAGVLVKISYQQWANFIVRQLSMNGVWSNVNVGILVLVGGSQSVIANCQVNFSCGTKYVGAGSMVLVGHPIYRVQVVQSNYGAGMGKIYVGAGSLVEIGLPLFIGRVCTTNMGVGADNFLGAGDFVMAYSPRYAANVFLYGAAIGELVYVGAGIGVFIRNYINAAFKFKKSHWPYTYTVQGYGAGKAASFGILVLPLQGKRVVSTPKPTARKLPALPSRDTDESGSEKVTSEDSNQKEIKGRTNTIYVAGNEFHNFQYSFRDLPELPESRPAGRMGGGPNVADVVFRSMMRSKDVVKTEVMGGGKIYISNNTNCVASCLSPGTTADHMATAADHKDAPPAQCFTTDTCGRTVNETLNLAMAEATSLEDKEQVRSVEEVLKGKHAIYNAFKGLSEVVDDVKTGHRRLRHLQEDGQFDPEVLPNAYLISSLVTVWCNYRDPSLNSNEITTNCTSQAVLNAVMKMILVDPLTGDAKITAAEQKVRPFFVDQVDPLFWESLRPNNGPPRCMGYTTFQVSITMVDEGVFNEALQAFNELVGADNEALVDTLEGATRNVDKVVCGITIKKPQTLNVPPYTKQDTYYPKGVVSPGVTVVKEGEPVPIATVYPQMPYTIYIYNFPEGSTVSVQLLNNASKPVPPDQFPAFRIRNFDDIDDNGELKPVAYQWTVSSALPLGKYYFRATSPGILTYSQQALSVQAPGTRARRHLFG